jgi:hypothetical protein
MYVHLLLSCLIVFCKVPGSDLGPETDYPDRGLLRISSVLPGQIPG